MTLPRPRAFLFDWDNTLIDSWGAIHHALNVTLEAMGQPTWTLEETQARVRRSARESFSLLFGERAGEALDIFYRTFEADHLEKLRAYEGAEELIEALASRGTFYLAVVSNKRGHILRREVAHLGWDAHFSRLVGANDAARDKPAVEAVDLALADSGLERGPQVWFVGDTDIDMECAVESGCLPVLLRRAPPEEGEFGSLHPRVHVTDCRHLLRTIQDL